MLKCAATAHSEKWTRGKDVSLQTKKAQNVCKAWQNAVEQKFPGQFDREHPIREGAGGSSQKIDLVSRNARTAYELKASPNNVHMEIYRDVFKVLVYNVRREKKHRMEKLVFVAPREGIAKLGDQFLVDVKAIALKLELKLEVWGL